MQSKSEKLKEAIDVLEKNKRQNMKKAQEQLGGCISILAISVSTALLVWKLV